MANNNQHLNPNFLKKNFAALKAVDLFNEIKEGNVTSLSQGITLLESDLPAHKEKATELLKLCLPLSGNSIRIGITGIPGAGKSTFIESIGKLIVQEKMAPSKKKNFKVDEGEKAQFTIVNEHFEPEDQRRNSKFLEATKNKLAVLAIDPSSSLSKGSILGDKTRMEELSRLPEVFIRPTPTSGNLGGVARATKESMILCEAAGFNIIMVETVGVGQSEIELLYLTDIFLLLLIPGAGNELQGIKRGIMEIADMILVNKAEANNKTTADKAVKQLENAVHYIQQNKYGRFITVHSISALEGKNVPEMWTTIKDNLQNWKGNKSFFEKRRSQAGYWFDQSLANGLKNIIHQRSDWQKLYLQFKKEIEAGDVHPFAAADEMLHRIVSGTDAQL